MITYDLPIRLESEPNLRDHWAKRNKRRKAHLKASIIVAPHKLPCIVIITRVGPRPLDTDNLAASAKFLRDGIAARLGVDDADPRVEWRYQQQRGDYSVIVEIEPAGVEFG